MMITEEQKTILRKLDQRSRARFRWILAYEQIGKVAPICRYIRKYGPKRMSYYLKEKYNWYISKTRSGGCTKNMG